LVRTSINGEAIKINKSHRNLPALNNRNKRAKHLDKVQAAITTITTIIIKITKIKMKNTNK
jgi:hypothetical protein